MYQGNLRLGSAVMRRLAADTTLQQSDTRLGSECKSLRAKALAGDGVREVRTCGRGQWTLVHGMTIFRSLELLLIATASTPATVWTKNDRLLRFHV